MVFKKNCSRIISVILAICALSALCAVCAVSVSADSIDTSHIYFRNQFFDSSGNNNFNRFDTDFSYLYQRSPMFPTSGGYVLQNCLFKLPLTSSPSNVLFSCSMTWTVHNDRNAAVVSSDVASYFQSTFKPVYFILNGSPTLLTSLYTSPSSSFTYDSSLKVFTVSVYFFADLSSIEVSSTDFNNFYIGFQVKSLEGFFYSSNQYAPVVDLRPVSLISSDFAVDTDPPEPPPEPSEDGWIYPSSELYFTNISDSTFSFNNLNYPFSTFPSKDIIIDDSPSKIIVGSFFDNTDWLSSGSTVSGQLQIQFTSPLTSVDNFVQRGFIWLVNGSDPSLSGFQYYEIPTSWEYMFTVWKYGVNQWTNEYIFNFEFTFPDDLSQTIGFTPANILFGLYGILPAGSFSTECWYNVQNLVFGYYIPPSSGDSEVPSTPVFNNPDNTSTVINPSQPTVTDNLNTELGFYDNVWKSYNITTDTFLNFFEEVIGFGYSNLDDALGRLYQAFSYDGSGSIYLPSATIPFGDGELHLWDQTEIPLSYWFSNLPSQIKVVFGFIIVFSVASACWGITFFFIRKIVSGNYQAADF